MGFTLTRRPLVMFFVIGAVAIVFLLALYYNVHPTQTISSALNTDISSSIGQMFVKSDRSQDPDIQRQLDMMSFKLNQQRALIEGLSCKVNGIGARGGFCLQTDNFDVGGNSWWDSKLAINMEELLFTGQSVGDFGAGLGWYGRYWMRKTEPIFSSNIHVEQTWYFNRTDIMQLVTLPKKLQSWKGFDGAGNVEEVTNGWVSYLDLTDEQELPIKFDWVMSLEVGEHIPHIYEQVFIDNLVHHACKGIVLSWAVEGQGGHFHVNNHNNDYVKKVFAERGFKSNVDVETKLRSNVVLGHFANTVMVFERINPLKHPKCPSNT